MSIVWQEGAYKIIEYRYNNNKEWRLVPMLDPHSVGGFHCYVKSGHTQSSYMNIKNDGKPFATFEEALQASILHAEEQRSSIMKKLYHLLDCKVGDYIWSIRWGWEKIAKIQTESRYTYPIITVHSSYTMEGFDNTACASPIAFTKVPPFFEEWSEPKPVVFEKGDRVHVKNCVGSSLNTTGRAYFSHMDRDLFCCYINGGDEWSQEGSQ